MRIKIKVQSNEERYKYLKCHFMIIRDGLEGN